MSREDWLMYCWSRDLGLEQTLEILVANGHSVTETMVTEFAENAYAEMMGYYEEQARLNQEANMEFEEDPFG